MRQLTTIIAGLTALGCTCSPGPEVDAPDDGAPLAPIWDLEVLSDEPCEPWDAIPLERSALPADPTPRILWVWTAGADPRFVDATNARMLSFRHLVQPVIAPDGSLRLWGPDLSSITALGRDGEFMWLAGPGVRTSEEGFLGYPMVDPEGTTWMVSRGTPFGGATPVPVLHSYADGSFMPRLPLPGIYPFIGTLGGRPQLSVGSTGQLVLNPGPDGGTLSTCRGRPEWRGTGPGPSIRMRSGELWSTDGGGLVDRHGAHRPSDLVLPPQLVEIRNSYTYFSAYPYTDETFSLSLSFPVVPGSASAHEWLGRSGNFVELDTSNWITSPRPTGVNALWVITAGSTPEQRRFSYVVDGLTEGSAEITTGLAPTLPADDGSLLIIEYTSPPALIHLLTDGTIAWRVPLVNTDGTALTGVDAAPTVDRHGVFYAATGLGGVIAVQTDTLPPPDGTCMVGYCNARRDLAMYYPSE